jgi:hypothetical protein
MIYQTDDGSCMCSLCQRLPKDSPLRLPKCDCFHGRHERECVDCKQNKGICENFIKID